MMALRPNLVTLRRALLNSQYSPQVDLTLVRHDYHGDKNRGNRGTHHPITDVEDSKQDNAAHTEDFIDVEKSKTDPP